VVCDMRNRFATALLSAPSSARENEPRAARQMRRCPRSVGQRVQSHALLVRQNQRNLGASQSHTRLLVDEYAGAAPLISHLSRSGP
jgi:hypothetical protein